MMISKAAEKRMLEAACTELRKGRLSEVVRVAAGLPKPPAEVITYGSVTVTLPDGRQLERVDGGWIDEFVRGLAPGQQVVMRAERCGSSSPPMSISLDPKHHLTFTFMGAAFCNECAP